jgi:hypothetical protein
MIRSSKFFLQKLLAVAPYILSVYKEALILHNIQKLTQQVNAQGHSIDMTNFSHGASEGIFDFKNPQ